MTVRLGSSAIAQLARNEAVRKAVVTGVAFGAGFQLSRALRTRKLPGWVSSARVSARDVYHKLNDHDPQAEGRLAGRWVRESFTVISSVYNVVERKNT